MSENTESQPIDDVEGHGYKRPDAQLGEESGDDDVQGHRYTIR